MGSAVAGLRILPEPSALALGATLGSGFAGIDSHYRRLARANLQLVFPSWSDHERGDLLRRSFEELGRSATEWARLPSLSSHEVTTRVDLHGLQHLEEALGEGRGALVVSAHYGYWELILRALSVALPASEITAVGRAQPNPFLDKMVTRRRSLGGVSPLAQNAQAILRALHRNAAVGLLADHYLSKRHGGVLVPFLGTPAWSNPGPATLALRMRCPVLVAHARRIAGNHHRIEVESRLELPSGGDRQADIAELTGRINQAIGRLVRRHPELWLWCTHRWRASPDVAPDLYPSRRRGRASR
jgi:KDO2-lipid IV(A) lauroyltransferase